MRVFLISVLFDAIFIGIGAGIIGHTLHQPAIAFGIIMLVIGMYRNNLME
jgi:hypothetical protein